MGEGAVRGVITPKTGGPGGNVSGVHYNILKLLKTYMPCDIYIYIYRRFRNTVT